MKYSILIPAYKAKFYKECLNSVLSLDYTDYEVIVLNDCSPEPIKEITAEFSSPLLRYYENEKNVGAKDLVDNWNKLLEMAKGDYVICMGDDDVLPPHCLKAYDDIMSKYPDLYIYHARTLMIDENSEPCDIQEERPEWESMYSMLWHMMFKGRGQFIGDFLFDRQALIRQGGFYNLPYAMASDWLTCLIAAKDKGIANIQSPAFYYRTSRYTITGNVPGKDLWEATEEYYEEIKKLLKEVPQDDIDKIYRQGVLDKMDWSYSKSISDAIASDLATTRYRTLFFWIKNRKKAKISGLSIIYAMMLAAYRMRKEMHKNKITPPQLCITFILESTFNSGGMERMLTTICNAVAAMRGTEGSAFRVTALSAFNEGRPDFFPFDGGVARVDLGIRRAGMAPKDVKKVYKQRLTEWLSENPQDVVVSLGSLEYFFLPDIKDGSRKIFWFHFAYNYDLETCHRTPWMCVNRLIGRLTQRRRTAIARRYDHVVVLSRADLETWQRAMGRDAHKVSYIYNPLTLAPKAVESYATKRAIAVGRIERQKGYDYLVRAWEEVHRVNPDWKLDIYGNGEEHAVSALQRQIDSAGLTDVVTLCGRSSDIAAEYARHSLMILSSRYEGLVLVLIEAAACGLPLVSYDCEQGPKEIIDEGENGFLVRPVGNISGLADAINRLADDENLRQRMGTKARDLTSRFAIEHIAEVWRALLSE